MQIHRPNTPSQQDQSINDKIKSIKGRALDQETSAGVHNFRITESELHPKQFML